MTISAIGQVEWMAFDARGQLLAIRDNDGVRVYDYLRQASLIALPRTYSRCAFSPDGRFLACDMYVWSDDFIRKVKGHRIDIWNVADKQVIASVDLAHSKEQPVLSCLEFSSDSAWLAVVRMDGLVAATHLATRQTVHLEQPREGRFFMSMPSCFFFPRTCILAYTYLDEVISFVDLSTKQRIPGLRVNDMFQLVGYTPSERIVVAMHGKDDYDNQIAILDTDTGALLPLVGGIRGYRWSPSCVTLSQGGEYVAAIVFKETPGLLSAKATFSVGVWDARTGSALSELITDRMSERGLSPSVFSLAFSPGNRLFVGRRDAIEVIPLGAGTPSGSA